MPSLHTFKREMEKLHKEMLEQQAEPYLLGVFDQTIVESGELAWIEHSTGERVSDWEMAGYDLAICLPWFGPSPEKPDFAAKLGQYVLETVEEGARGHVEELRRVCSFYGVPFPEEAALYLATGTAPVQQDGPARDAVLTLTPYPIAVPVKRLNAPEPAGEAQPTPDEASPQADAQRAPAPALAAPIDSLLPADKWKVASTELRARGLAEAARAAEENAALVRETADLKEQLAKLRREDRRQNPPEPPPGWSGRPTAPPDAYRCEHARQHVVRKGSCVRCGFPEKAGAPAEGCICQVWGCQCAAMLEEVRP